MAAILFRDPWNGGAMTLFGLFATAELLLPSGSVAERGCFWCCCLLLAGVLVRTLVLAAAGRRPDAAFESSPFGRFALRVQNGVYALFLLVLFVQAVMKMLR